MRRLVIFALICWLLPTALQAKSLEDLLVERGVITRAEAQGAASVSAPKVHWNRGTRFEFPDNGFTAGFTTQLQERYTFTDNDEKSGKKNTSSFDLRRARLIVSGTALHNEFSYLLNADFVGAKGSDGAKTTHLRDAYLAWNACDWAEIRMGQYKTFISRQENTSSWRLQFPDRTVASDYFQLGRQGGLSGKFKTDDDMFVLRAGVFNGQSDGEGINRSGIDTKHTGVVEARINPLGKMDAYSETDVDYTEDLALSFGAAYAYSDMNSDIGMGVEDISRNTLSVDASMKVQGFSMNGEFFWANMDADSSRDEPDLLGFYVQAGYFLAPKKFEVAARYGYLDCDNGKGWGECSNTDKINEVGVALNYYWWKHHLKAALAYTFVGKDPVGGGSDINTNKWMFQLSSYF